MHEALAIGASEEGSMYATLHRKQRDCCHSLNPWPLGWIEERNRIVAPRLTIEKINS